MDRVRDAPPASDLIIAVKTGGADNQPSRRALHVVITHQGGWYSILGARVRVIADITIRLGRRKPSRA
jgi:hypothetical protein